GAPMLAPTTTCVPPPGLPSPPLPLPTPLAGSLTVVTHPMIDPHEERCRTMRTCQRRLFLGNAMASHAARDVNRREAYLLIQLSQLAAWQGSIVHRVLATDFQKIVQSGRSIDPAALTATACHLARRQFAFSEARRYREPG